jgi:electron transport complex protein RnfB
MSEEVYKKLAQRLNAIPNGFPATDSGVELKILEKIFTPQEAKLASVMRLTPEPAAEIAARAQLNLEKAEEMLRAMARQGLIRARKTEDRLVFGLIPFVVGIYENQLPRMDEELAALCEQYFQETGGSMLGISPSLHRVIPIEQAISFSLEVFPHERAIELLESARSWGVRRCICRVQKRLIGKGCDHEVENCLVFAPVEHAFDNSQDDRPITKEEALNILRETEQAGLIHSTANHRGPLFYICNCCTCCCGIMRGVVEWGNPDALARSDFRVVVDTETCTACETCVARCQFKALSVPEEVCAVDYDRCMGCGQCVSVCPVEALKLERRPERELPEIPADERTWMERRAEERGIDIGEIL